MAMIPAPYLAMFAASAALAAPAPPCAPANGFTPRVCGDLGEASPLPIPIPLPMDGDAMPKTKACHACRREDAPAVKRAASRR